MKKSRRLLIATILGFGLGILARQYSLPLAREVSDLMFRTPDEIRLEDKIGKPVSLGFFVHGKERLNEISWFDSTYDLTRKTYDNFDRQFNLASRVTILRRMHGFKNNVRNAEVDEFTRELRISYEDASDAPLVHELAHLWSFHLSQRDKLSFTDKWRKISGNHYIKSWQNGDSLDVVLNGTFSQYGLHNIEEDITETTRLVYVLSDMDRDLTIVKSRSQYARRLSQKILPKFKEKIKLLRDYGFISEKEYVGANNKLNQ
ncbi:MAG: putative zinc-binding metallopeptidase [Nanoarchaeota archaeon]|mgnify:FL=1